jgi:chromosome segregation protein
VRLKKLEIVGFKSFLEKTSFDFTTPITGIVGPNGCGKSNVVDAIKWVTGELSFKELRGRSMQDLIFSGSELRPPTGMAEVCLTLDNSDGCGPPLYKEFSEISVLRRVFRDGTSEYEINKTGCRLRDVIDIFLDTGIGQSSYSIIEQGRVGQIVASKAEDRRIIIEEAAGITKFKHRKKAAERKMEYTRQNLLRVSDVLSELKRQIGSLERQARKAEQYKAVSEEARALDTALSSRSYVELHKDVAELKTSETTLASDLEFEQTELTVKEAGMERRQIQGAQTERALQEAQQKLLEGSSELTRLEHRIENSTREAESAKHSAERDRAQAETLRPIQEELEAKAIVLTKTSSEMEADQIQIDAEMTAGSEERVRLDDALKGIEVENEAGTASLLECVAAEAELKNKMLHLEQRAHQIEVSLEQKGKEFARTMEELARLETSYTARQRDLGVAVQLRFGFEREQGDARRRLEQLHAEKLSGEKELNLTEQKLEGIRSRIRVIEEFERTYQGYGKGVRFVMENRTTPEALVGNVLGLLGEQVHPQRGFERAVEAALKDWINCVVVDSPRDALRAIEFLKEDEKGRASFLPASFRKDLPIGNLPEGEGVLGWLLGFVDIRSSAASIRAVLQNVVVVDSLPRAVALWEDGCELTLVTRDGDMITKSGVVEGGSWGTEKGVLQLHGEIEELQEQVNQMELQREQLRRSIGRTEKEIAFIASELERVALILDQEAQKAFAHEKEFERLGDAVARCRQTQALIEDESQKLKNDRVVNAELIGQLRSQRSETEQRRIRIESDMKVLAEKVAATRALISKQDEILTNLKIRKASFEERLEANVREHRSIQQQLQFNANEQVRLRASAEELLQKAGHFTEQAALDSTERDAQVVRLTELQTNAQMLRSEYETIAAELQSSTALLKEVRDRVSQLQNNLGQVRLKLQEETLRLGYLETQFHEKYSLSLQNYVGGETFQVLPEDQVQSSQERLAILREKMGKIGDVHLGSIEELKELSERYQFLGTQKEDLEKTLDSLVDAIRKINSTTRERFQQTFEDVNAKFKEVFPQLFRGGKAHLVLTDPENLLESGIDIVAQPPGKRLQNMNLLSGGEKALTAIAMLFAIFLHKAPPFCLLDEVDAPLDDLNVRRYVSQVEKMASNTQFILITHNKLSMESADNLYGVTMEEPGVSRVVSVRISNAQTREEVQPKEAVA